MLLQFMVAENALKSMLAQLATRYKIAMVQEASVEIVTTLGSEDPSTMIPAIVELCIQAGVDLPQYPTRRRTAPVRMIGKKVIDRGGVVDEPKPHRSEDCISLLAELDTFSNQQGQSPVPSNVKEHAERTLKAYCDVRQGVAQLMSKYMVKACGYCSEVHVGPWGHNVKLCGAFKHQWRDGKHGWQDAVVDEVIPLTMCGMSLTLLALLSDPL